VVCTALQFQVNNCQQLFPLLFQLLTCVRFHRPDHSQSVNGGYPVTAAAAHPLPTERTDPYKYRTTIRLTPTTPSRSKATVPVVLSMRLNESLYFFQHLGEPDLEVEAWTVAEDILLNSPEFSCRFHSETIGFFLQQMGLLRIPSVITVQYRLARSLLESKVFIYLLPLNAS
jgi:hypothetical protein